MPPKDPEARRQYNQQWYQANKPRVSKEQARYYQENRAAHNARTNKRRNSLHDFIDDQKKGKACVRCGIADYRVLDFHHIDPSQKKINLNMAWKQNVGKQAILAEIAKCELICANCHRILHWEERHDAMPPQSVAL